MKIFLEDQARRTPDAVAVQFEETRVSYRELNRRANRLARTLAGRGVTTDSLVGVYMERSVEMVVALVAILKAGGAYVPFDPDYPQDRLAFMFEDSAISVVLTQHRFDQHDIPKTIGRIALDEPVWAATDDADEANPPLVSHPDSAAYMIYTSGSTGKPKGVVNIHRGLVNRILWMQDEYQLTASDRVLQKTPYSFDVSVWEFFWPLMTGATIVMAVPGGHRDNAYLVDTIVDRGITTMHFVPSMLNLFVGSEGLERITTLRQVMSSGEALPLALTLRFFARLPQTRLHNLYGPTEASIDVTYWECRPDSDKNVVPIGYPIANTQMHILDDALNPVPVGDEGELHIGGIGLARGYWNRPELTAQRFIPDPFGPPGARLYKTGDLARYLPDGAIEYLGRLDFQVKLRGFRIELGEIEAVILKHPGISETVVVASEDDLEEKQLVAYVVAKGEARTPVGELKKFLLGTLPEYMVPARFLYLTEMPLLPNGKVNRKELPQDLQARPELAEMFIAAQTPVEKSLVRLWSDLLNLKEVGIRDNFFDLGGNSLLAIRLAAELRKNLEKDVPVVRIFQYPTIEKLALHLAGGEGGNKLLDEAFERATRIRIGRFSGDADTDGVAVIGMVGRFPGAENLDELWDNLINKRESITRFSLDEVGPGIDDETRLAPNYVPTRGIVTDADKFDAPFFGIGPLEAKVMDPQQRVFLELAWAALENAGYDPARFPGMIGVFAGVGDNHYFTNNVLGHPDLIKTVGKMIVGYGNEKDYVATRASYCLNLTGPSVSANTGCSTSLLSVDHGFKSLIDFECDMALAGGVDLFFPQKSGQLYEEGGTFTEDGHCRPFDAEATGTMFCDGAGVVVLRRLADAVAAGDKIYAVVRGVAKNNDGANKVSFLAPSVEGQAQVIALAQAQANTPADTISYIEAHGTGTPLGDPIEVEALTKAFRATTDKTQFCHLGSVKGNIGHPTIASGVAGFIKATLALHHEIIPATLHFKNPNPKIDFAASPFKVVQDTTPWPRSSTPRRAGVSSFGFGGTNVHAVLEEAPVPVTLPSSRPRQLLLLSAKTDAALGRQRRQFAKFWDLNPGPLADAAFTLAMGRRHHAFREFVVAGDPTEAAALLVRADERKTPAAKLSTLNPPVVFLFPGQGSQYVNMGLHLYSHEPEFRRWVDRCCDLLRPHLDRDLRELLFPAPDDEKTATESLKDTYYTQPALFTIEYALARFWMSLGVVPSAMVGHSVGEFVCACLAGIVSLEDILPMVALRGRLIRGLPRGSMLSVRCPAAQLEPRLPADIQLAASNSPNLCVVAGPVDAVTAFAQTLEAEGLVTKELHTSHAFHSAMMEPIVAQYVEAMRGVSFVKASIPILSTCTADWLTDEVAGSPEYWGRHLRMPVRFSEAISTLVKEPGKVYLEIGPRDVLTTLARQHVGPDQREMMVPSLPSVAEESAEWTSLLAAVGHLWQRGVEVDWETFWGGERRQRVPLPTYPFERTVCWLDPVAVAPAAGGYLSTAPEPAPPQPEPPEAGSKVEAFDGVLSALSTILSDTLGMTLDPQAVDTPFLTLGADSLLLMQLGRVVHSKFGLTVTFRQLVEEYATPGLLAAAIRAVVDSPAPAVPKPEHPGAVSELSGTADSARLGTDRQGRPAWFLPHPERPDRFVRVVGAGTAQNGRFSYPVTDDIDQPFRSRERLDLPATPGQYEMSSLIPPLSCAFGESFSIQLKGPLDRKALSRSLGSLTDFHQALRGHLSAGGTRFIIEPEVRIPVDERDFSGLSGAEQNRRLSALEEDLARTPYPIETGPLVRAAVVTLGQERHMVFLGAHRIVSDGWSLDVLLEDFSKLYSAFVGAAPLPATPGSCHSDYVAHRESAGFSDRASADRQYWTGLYPKLPDILRFPRRGKPAQGPGEPAVHRSQTLSPAVTTAVKAFARVHGLSLFSVMLTGFTTLVQQRLGTTGLVVGIPVAGHPEGHWEDAVGALATIIPLRVRSEPGDNFLSLARRNQQAVLDGREHAAVGASEVPTVGKVPLAFSHMHKYSPEKLRFAGCSSEYHLTPRAFETYDLSLVLVESAHDLEWVAHAAASAFDGLELGAFLDELEQVLAEQCGTREAPMSEPAKPEGPPQLIVEPPIIVTLQKGSPGRTPLLCLLGIQLYYDLAMAIDDGTPVVGIHVPMLYDPRSRPTLTEVARHYLAVIRTVQPRGPYQLAGLCLGGMVAYEVGRLLELQGEELSLVVMFDAVLPRGRHTNLAVFLREHLFHPFRSLGALFTKSRKIADRALGTSPAGVKNAVPGGLVELPLGTPGAVGGIELLATEGPPLNTHLIAFRASAEPLSTWDLVHADMGWASAALSVQFCTVDADHLAIVRQPHAQQVAAVIKRQLRTPS